MPRFATHTERDQLVHEKLTAAFGADLLGHEQQVDLMCWTLPKGRVHDALRLLRDELDFNFLTTLCGMHFPGTEKELGVVYHLHSMRNGHRIRLKSFTTLKDAEFDTATDLWPTANWMEREAWDFFGIKFKGHPNLIRILNMEDFPAFPMRKDYPMEDPTRRDKNDSMFGR
ncbi:MAG TPA: NADH-quinone oxidoreductase subunit C [Flavobacteriales bacterium]|nr:NADH-quinone oxidoreductase subunit C [Flavobacteriales bacterium]HQX28399.1 NADH-quinone oxidoreductase subunit C [Flavobacteriales bacterium]HQX37100.1 NADH-quinone oxidoreductase subunit C [Flavobacteriales bacterium]HQZ92476.1 NADH-quinone oxidoreductase subunit C [Flavobacteriales bacterium]